jgi:HAD superfamily hydrolase (TIGR01493 family)
MSRARGVLFDVGYGLFDETARLEACIRWLASEPECQAHGSTPAALLAAYHRACEAPRADEPSLIVQALQSLGFTREECAALRKRAPWDAVPLEPYPDARAALERLRAAGLKLGVLANQPASAVEDVRRAGFEPLLDGVWISNAVGLHKPDPRFFQLALDAWKLAPRDVAYVGDRPDMDVAPARRVGMYALRLRRGPHSRLEPRDDGERPDCEAASLADAAERLLAWARAQ